MTPQDRYQALDIIHRCLLASGHKLVTAESLTCGMIASQLAATSGCSAYLRGGFVVYDIDMKVELLGVDRELAASCNCVSPAVAMQMALGAKKRTGAECAISTTGYAEAWHEKDIHAPYAYYTVLAGGASSQGRVDGAGLDRWEMREAVTTRVLCELAMMLEALDEG